jgi:MazG family protein
MELNQFASVKKVVDDLRHPTDGCPWDLKQTHESLLKYLIEESYEYIDAVEQKDPKKMEEELGDVLLQVLLHSRLGSEKKLFDIESVSKTLKEKLIRRHPHVFENKNTSITADEVLLNWAKIKEEEKSREENEKNGSRRIKESIMHNPALVSAAKIGKRTNELKFDWDDYQQVAYKVEEEWQELKEEITPANGVNRERAFEELGDLLFSVAQLARHLELDPEAALRAANKKFLKRFYSMEDIMNEKNIVLENLNQTQMDVYWALAKQKEKNEKNKE